MILTYCHYTLLDTSMDDILTPITKQKEIGLINAAPLYMGALTEKGAPPWHPAPEQMLAAVKKTAVFYKKKERSQNLGPSDAVRTRAPGRCNHRYRNEQATKCGCKYNLIGKKPDAELLKEVLEIIKPMANTRWKKSLPENDDLDAVDK
jgi:L-galactose dehydrogenase